MMPSPTANDYRKLSAYKNADAAMRRQLERWKTDQKISDEHMYLLMAYQTLRQQPPEKKKAGNHIAEILVVFSIVFFIFVMQSEDRVPLLIASVMVISSTVLYLTDILNPISAQFRQIRKALKKYPDVEEFAVWSEAHPVPGAKQDKT